MFLTFLYVYQAAPPGALHDVIAIKRSERPTPNDTKFTRNKKIKSQADAENEIKIIEYLRKDHYCQYIVRLDKYEFLPDYIYMGMELMSNSLDNLISQRDYLKTLLMNWNYCQYDKEKVKNSTNIGFTLDDTRNFLSEILKGLAHCHGKGVAHRDIKPGNMLIKQVQNKETGDSEILLKLADFGVAVNMTNLREKLTDTVGTKPYLAPEMHFTEYFRNASKEDPKWAEYTTKFSTVGKKLDNYIGYNEKVDIWALGCVSVELATGKMLYGSNDAVNRMVLNEVHDFQKHDCKYSFNEAVSMLPEYLKEDVLYDSFIKFLELCFKHNPKDRASVSDLQNHEFMYDEETEDF